MLRITTRWQGPAGSPYWTPLYFGGSTEGEADAAAAAIATWLGALDASLTNQITWIIDSESEFVDPLTGNITGVGTNAGGSGTGSSSTQPLPWATQGLIRWRTGQFVNGREIRGRTFVPGLTEDATTNGRMDATFLSSLNTQVTTFLNSLSGAGGLVVYSPTHNQQAAVQSASYWGEMAVLRSRRD